MKTYKCDRCQVEKPGRKAKLNGSNPPTGWARIGAELMCKECKNAAYAIRCVSVRIASIVGDVDTKTKWAELRAALKYSWGQTTKIANWALRTLALSDVVIGNGEKLPKLPKTYLYGECNAQGVRGNFPSDATLSTLTRAEALYQRDRFEVCRGRKSLSSVRYPQPMAMNVGKGSLSLMMNDERVAVRCRVPYGPGEDECKVFTLLVAQGRENWRTTAALKRMIAGEVFPAEMRLKQSGKHIMLDVVAKFPRETKIADGTLYVRSGLDLFCECLSIQKQRLWALHADLCFRWIAEHRERLQSLSDDRKAERRNHRKRRGINRYTEQVCERHHNRMRSFMQETAAMIAKWAARQQCNTVLWDDWPAEQSRPNESRFTQFPWSEFRTLLTQRLSRDGISIVFHGESRGPVPGEDPEPLELS